LYNEATFFPEDSVDVIADRLAVRHSWTPEMRVEHLRRLRDIRRTVAMEARHQRYLVPAVRTPTSIDDYFAGADERAQRGSDELRLLDED
jgi:hypothetical protein